MKRALVFTALGLAALSSPVQAQSTAPRPGTTTTATDSTGAFQKLSPGNQKIANAIFEAQTTNGPTAPMTLDQIAALKQKGSGTGWGAIFKQMKAQGLVTDKNLGQAVKRVEMELREERARERQMKREDRTGARDVKRDDRPFDQSARNDDRTRGQGFTSRDFSRDFIDHGNVGAASPHAGGAIGDGNGHSSATGTTPGQSQHGRH